ncbi:Predicted transcriptional regulator, contains HTH domain [Halogranum amylolyticum]|uniref:Predicted transcriptional regulator, contains HTH domain n=1 Tax=Halogranum amylolyticum TaxID=660520 RepID=A0A1H8PTR7_9EURY|nr:ArsR family transcriptional regulator [Halogranum amylolyticum]SEO45151.1 Predicted transcriptional regulator, contains HTH domain [Halogranum amylolyticum]
MESALSEIEFLALSPNRVETLRLLADRPHTRRELVAETGASQPTVGRILGDFEERSWVVRDGGEYRTTATGTLVAQGFDDLLSIVDTEEKLRPVVRWLPTDAIGFDLERLADATITTPSQVRPNAPVKRALDLLGDAEEVRIFSYAFNEQSLDVITDRTAAGQQRFEGVFSSSAIDAIADDSRLRQQLHELLTAEHASIRITDEEIPVAATVADSVVHLFLRDDRGLLQASLDVDDPAVLAWADETFARYWETATPLDPEQL